MTTSLILHNIRSAHNVGAIFRTADAAGVSHIYLTGYTPTPRDRFGRIQKDIAKTALGAETYVPWTYAQSPRGIVRTLRGMGTRVVGVELDARSRDYRTVSRSKDTALLFGNEVRGLSPQLRDACDELVFIPMRGKKESLNVATTVGIVLFSRLP